MRIGHNTDHNMFPIPILREKKKTHTQTSVIEWTQKKVVIVLSWDSVAASYDEICTRKFNYKSDKKKNKSKKKKRPKPNWVEKRANYHEHIFTSKTKVS